MAALAKLLDASEQYPFVEGVYHLSYFHEAVSENGDRVSQFIHDFISGHEPQTTQWIRLAVYLAHQSVPFDFILREEPSSDLPKTSVAQLERLCAAMERKSGKRWFRDIHAIVETAPQQSVNLLVIGILLKDEAAIRAMSEKVKQELPDAQVRYLGLGLRDDAGENGHLDMSYFTSSVPPGAPPVAPKPELQHPPAVVSHHVAPLPPAERPRSAHSHRRWIGSVAALFSVAAVLLFSAFVLFARKPALPPPYAEGIFPDTTEVHPVVAIQPKVVAAPAAKAPDLPSGFITVPNVGLRGGHSLNASRVRASLRIGEKVSILQRYRSSTGPDWVQIKSRSGNVGWLWASLVREGKKK